MADICYIIGAGDVFELEFERDKSDYVICADGGFNYAQKFGVDCDLLLGDFDSIGTIPVHKNIKTFPSEKNETDLMLAVDVGLKNGYDKFVIFGALGGSRFEHSIANIQLLAYICENDARGIIVDNQSLVLAIKNDSIQFNSSFTGYVSVFSLSDISTNVTINGLKYEVEGVNLTNSFAVGVSNEFIGENSSVQVENGTLLIVLNGKFGDII